MRFASPGHTINDGRIADAVLNNSLHQLSQLARNIFRKYDLKENNIDVSVNCILQSPNCD